MTATQNKIAGFFNQFPAIAYAKSEKLLTAGSANHFFYYIETGAVKMSLPSSSGKTLMIHILFPGSFFPLLMLVNENSNEYDFTTLLPTTVRKAPITEVQTFLQTHPDVLFDLNQRLLKGLQGLIRRLEHSTLSSAYQQVADLLGYFATHFGEEKIKITHQEIADWLGLSRENVSLQMKQLEKDGLIAVHQHQISVTNLLKTSQS